MGKCASSMNFVKSALPHDIMGKNLFSVISRVSPGYTGDSPVYPGEKNGSPSALQYPISDWRGGLPPNDEN